VEHRRHEEQQQAHVDAVDDAHRRSEAGADGGQQDGGEGRRVAQQVEQLAVRPGAAGAPGEGTVGGVAEQGAGEGGERQAGAVRQRPVDRRGEGDAGDAE